MTISENKTVYLNKILNLDFYVIKVFPSYHEYYLWQ